MAKSGRSRWWTLGLVGALILLGSWTIGEGQEKKVGKRGMAMNSSEWLEKLVGSWEGTCKTWFQPGQLADESQVKGEIRPLLGGRFVRHTYEGMMQGKPRHGEETIVYNATKKGFQTLWIDDFHMNYGLLFSEGEATETGFCVLGSYDVGSGQPPWGWKTEFSLAEADRLTITSYNITPDGQEAKAVEVVYRRAD